MNNNILTISKKETFIVMSMEKQLRDVGFQVVHSESTVQALSQVQGDFSILIFYMEDGYAVEQDILVYLKDMSIEKDKMIILIGNNEEIKEATSTIPTENVAATFLRPFDMHGFLMKMHELTDEKERETRKKSVLIVDDDVTYLKMVQSWLKGKYRVSIVNSGLQAITWLAKNQVDLILLDYDMPVTDGPSILEMLKSETDTAKIPVFFLTGKRDSESIQRVVGLRPDRYLLKTIGKETLLAELEKFFIAQMTLR